MSSYNFTISQYFYPPRQIYLNSRFATSTIDPVKNNRCLFSIETIQMPPSYDNILISVEDAQIPVSFYSINENNNNIYITVIVSAYNDGNNTSYGQSNVGHDLYTIPVGNYDAYTLSLVLQQMVNAYFTTTYGNKYTQISILYEIATNQFTFKVINSYPTPALFNNVMYPIIFVGFDSISSAAVWGFNGPTTQSKIMYGNNGTVNIFNGSLYSIESLGYINPITSPYSIDLAGSRFIFVQCPTFGTVNVNSKTGSVNQIIAKIPITEDYLNVQQYTNRGYSNKIHNNKAITVIEVALLDENLNDINFNGADWAITLTIVILGMPPEKLNVINDNINLTSSQNNNIVQ